MTTNLADDLGEIFTTTRLE